jgi:hypothetical protein
VLLAGSKATVDPTDFTDGFPDAAMTEMSYPPELIDDRSLQIDVSGSFTTTNEKNYCSNKFQRQQGTTVALSAQLSVDNIPVRNDDGTKKRSKNKNQNKICWKNKKLRDSRPEPADEPQRNESRVSF